MNRRDVEKFDILLRGNLELSLDEAEILSDLVVNAYDFIHAIKGTVPQELHAIRDKLSLLRSSLREEDRNRKSILHSD